MQDVRDRGLRALGELDDYRVAEGNPDIRGWEVQGGDRRRIGKVDDLLVDVDAMKARYMTVRLDRAMLGLGKERCVVLPIGRVRIDRARDSVFVDDVTAANIDTLTDYDAATFRDQERTLFGGESHARSAEAWNRDATRGMGEAGIKDEARVVLREEELDVGKETVSAGEAVVRKHVDTERTEQTVPLMHEEVIVERRVLAPGEATSGEVIVTEEEVRIPLKAEEPTIGKRVVATEEVVVKKVPVEEQRRVEGEIRREVADVDTPAGVRKSVKEPEKV